MRENLVNVSKHSLISRCLSSLVIICFAAASIFTAALPISASGSDYVLKVSNRSSWLDCVKYVSDYTLDPDETSAYMLCFDAKLASGTDSIQVRVNTKQMMFDNYGMVKTAPISDDWTYYRVYIPCTAVSDFNFAIYGVSGGSTADLYVRNVYLFDVTVGLTPGVDTNLLTGDKSSLPLDGFSGEWLAHCLNNTASTSVITFSEPNTWEPTGCVPYCLYTTYSTGMTTPEFTVASIGDQIQKFYYDTPSIHHNLYWCNSAFVNIERNCTYTISFEYTGEIEYFNDRFTYNALPNNLLSFSVSDVLPTFWNEIEGQWNLEGLNYIDLVDVNYSEVLSDDTAVNNENFTRKNGVITYTYVFCTADGYIDNINSGSYYLNFCMVDEDLSDNYDFFLSNITLDVVADPNAEYYQSAVLDKLGEKSDELTIVGGKASENENWALDKADELRKEAKQQMSLNLDLTKSFLAGSTFSGNGGVAASAAAFGTIYNQVVSAVPGELQALLIIIPTLAFIGWVIGRVQ